MCLEDSEARLWELWIVADPHVDEVEETGAKSQTEDVEPDHVAELKDQVKLNDDY